MDDGYILCSADCKPARTVAKHTQTQVHSRHIPRTRVNTCMDSALYFSSAQTTHTIWREINTILLIYTSGCRSTGWGRLFLHLRGKSPRTGQTSSCPCPAPGTSWSEQALIKTSVIRLGKWRQLTRPQLRLKPHGPVCKLHCSHKQSH